MLQSGTGGRFGTGEVLNDAQINFNQSNGLIVSNKIIGTGAVRILGSGALTLAGKNLYSSGTTVSGERHLSAPMTPANNSMLSMADRVTLSWTPPPEVMEYDVNLGPSATSVLQATTGTPVTYKGRVTGNEYPVAGFTNGATNYWRIDFRLADGTVVKGPVWNFTLVTEQDPMMDTWVATDGLNRILPGPAEAGPPHLDLRSRGSIMVLGRARGRILLVG